MKIVRTVAEMRKERRGRVALVPTMGAFHEGHLSLMREARKSADLLVCSLFVNPTQFGAGEDFSRYPRNEAKDTAMAESVGVDILFAPSVDEMYTSLATVVSVKGVSDNWEGAHRPGHFDGVATVVCKLFNIVQPDSAFFGLKDLQQCAVVRQMVTDLNMPIELVFCPTVREEDGLAMSSRNVYLSQEDRSRAAAIYAELQNSAKLLMRAGASDAQSVLDKSISNLEERGIAVDYFALVDTYNMAPRNVPEKSNSIVVAARVGSTRLIDNIQLD